MHRIYHHDRKAFFTEADEMEFKAYLESIGDSIVCVADDEIVRF